MMFLRFRLRFLLSFRSSLRSRSNSSHAMRTSSGTALERDAISANRCARPEICSTNAVTSCSSLYIADGSALKNPSFVRLDERNLRIASDATVGETNEASGLLVSQSAALDFEVEGALLRFVEAFKLPEGVLLACRYGWEVRGMEGAP